MTECEILITNNTKYENKQKTRPDSEHDIYFFTVHVMAKWTSAITSIECPLYAVHSNYPQEVSLSI